MKNKNTPEVYENYEKIINWYDQNRTKTLMERDYLNLVLKHLPDQGIILDLGCGTGEPLAQFFIEKGFQVTGVDAAKNMISLCKKRFPTMTWILEDMRKVDLETKFDAIIAWDSFFHLNPDDQRAMFKIFESHINPSGILVFTSDVTHGEIWGKMDGHDFYHASLDTQEYENLLKLHNFTILLHCIQDPNCGDHTVWVVRYKGSP